MCFVKICEYAEAHDADLLVLASRGLGAVKRFLLGSVSGYCVHNCKVPTLVVKEDGTAAQRATTETRSQLFASMPKSTLIQDIE